MTLYFDRHDDPKLVGTPIDPETARVLLDKGVKIVRVLDAFEDDHELCVVVECESAERSLFIDMRYCGIMDTEHSEMLVWMLLGKPELVFERIERALRKELTYQAETDYRELVD